MIYYSHVNEDNFAERNIMMSSEYEDLFCIVGSGERLIALLDHSSLKRVHIIDMNAEALFLAELKLTALRVLSVEDYLSFIGFSNSGMNREFVFYGFQQELPLPSREYWNNNLTHIRNGIIHMGHFEQFLSRLRPLLRVLLGRGFYKCFEMPYSQLRSFPSFRWKIVKWLFSKKWSYLLFGNKDIAFIGEDALHKKIPYALHETLLNDRVSKNCMFHLVFNGHLGMMAKDDLPPSFQFAVLEQIKDHLLMNRFEISYHEQDMLAFINSFNPDQCGRSFYSLSDLLSFDDFPYMVDLLRSIEKKTNEAKIVFRSFIRNVPGDKEISSLNEEFNNFTDNSDIENTTMYSVYSIDVDE